MANPATMTTHSNYLKAKYGPGGVLVYNSSFAVTGMIEKSYDWVGGDYEEPIVLSQAVGVGSGPTLPQSANEKTVRVKFSDKDMYARAEISNKLIEKAKGGDSSWIDANKDKWERTQRGFAWNVERAFLNGNNPNGGLGTIISSSGVSGSNPYVCTISAATWKRFNWEVGNLVTVASGPDVFTVTAIDVSTPSVTLTRLGSGSQAPANSDVIYMQNSNGNDILSLTAALKQTSSTHHGVSIQYGWQAHQQLNVATSIDEELIDNAVLDLENFVGEGVDYLFTSAKQWKILKSANLNLKRYTVPNPNVPAKFSAALGFSALEYFSPAGSKPLPIMFSRFIEDDVFIGVNKRRVKLMHTDKPKWFDQDGTVFMRQKDSMDLEARFYSYMEAYIQLPYHFIITGLT